MKLSLLRLVPSSQSVLLSLSLAPLSACSDGASAGSSSEESVGTGGVNSPGSGGSTTVEGSGGTGGVPVEGTGGATGGAPIVGGTGGVTVPTDTTSICGAAPEGEALELSCPEGSVIEEVTFASFGQPSGECGAFVAGECHAPDSTSVVETACVGLNACAVVADNATFGGDPCSFTEKSLRAEVVCAPGDVLVGTGGAPGSGGEGSGGAPAGGSPGSGGSGGTDDGCPTELVGYATVNAEGINGTTGGGNASPTVVTTLQQLRSAVQDSAPRVVVVSGTINTTSDGDGYPLEVKSNKTVVGQDADATIVGGLTVKNGQNVIISNLNVQGVWPNSGPGDTLSTTNSHHVWFDHLNVWDAEDGLLDITNASDFQTVSWSKFWYTDASHGHRLASLNGSGGGDHPEDWGHLRVTYHHNWFAELVDQRMPRVMYGEGHQFNNYYNSPGNAYCIGVGSYGSILVENNYFKDVNDPILHMYDVYMYSAASGNIFDNTTGAQDTGFAGVRDACPGGDCSIQAGFEPGPFTPPYDYTLRPAEDVPEIVQRCAGPQ